MSTITERIEREVGWPGITAVLADQLSPTDLQSLLMEVYRRKAERGNPADVLAAYEANRFVRPSAASPLRLAEWERVAVAQLPGEFEVLALSPVCPLGTCSVVAGVSQDWSVATVRTTEVVSDSSNVLALECAVRRRRQLRSGGTSPTPVHLAASHRLLRAQRYSNPNLSAHFSAFAMCSAGRDQDDQRFEVSALELHIRFYLRALRAYLGPTVPLRLTTTDFARKEATISQDTRMFDAARSEVENLSCAVETDRVQGRGYYPGLCFHIYATADSGDEQQLVDGGAVPWTQRLLSNAKERLVISGIGSDRLCDLFVPRSAR